MQFKREIARKQEVEQIRAEQFKDGLDEFRVLKSKAIKMQCHGGREEQMLARKAKLALEVCCRVIMMRLIPTHRVLASSDAHNSPYLTLLGCVHRTRDLRQESGINACFFLLTMRTIAYSQAKEDGKIHNEYMKISQRMLEREIREAKELEEKNAEMRREVDKQVRCQRLTYIHANYLSCIVCTIPYLADCC